MKRSVAARILIPAGCLMSSLGLAASVEMGASKAEMSLEWRGEMGVFDKGLTNVEGGTAADSVTTINGGEVNLGLHGDAGDKVHYKFNWEFAHAKFEHAFFDYKASDTVTLRTGVDYVNQGGFENERNLYNMYDQSIYVDSKMAFVRSQPTLEVMGNFGPTAQVNLQLVNDFPSATSDPITAPTWNLEYRGGFGPANLMLQYGGYSGGESSYMTLGVNVKVSDINAYIDYTMDNKKDNAHSAIVADIHYARGDMDFFVKYSTYDVVQDGTDVEGNSATASETVSATMDDFEDNGTSISIGANLAWHKSYNPYFAYVMRSADFLDGDSTESRGDSNILIGVSGTI
jgi:hypothetical protein